MSLLTRDTNSQTFVDFLQEVNWHRTDLNTFNTDF